MKSGGACAGTSTSCSDGPYTETRKSGDASDRVGERGADGDTAAGGEPHDADARGIDAPGRGVPASEPQRLLRVGNAHAQHLGQRGVVRSGIGVGLLDVQFLAARRARAGRTPVAAPAPRRDRSPASPAACGT